MNIVEFFELSSGKWFSQRTHHYLDSQQIKDGKSDLYIEKLPGDHPDVIELCAQGNMDPKLALFGVRSKWEGTIGTGKVKDSGITLLVTLSNPDSLTEGHFLQAANQAEQKPVVGRYSLGADEALTLIWEDEQSHAEERLWYASPNLRLRNSVIKQADGLKVAAFCSEIRMGGLPTPPSN